MQMVRGDGDGAGRMLGGVGRMRVSASGGAAGAGQDGGRMQERGSRGMPGRRGASRGCCGGRREAAETPAPPPTAPSPLTCRAPARGGTSRRKAGASGGESAAPPAGGGPERGPAPGTRPSWHRPRCGDRPERGAVTAAQTLLVYWTLQRERRGRCVSTLGAAPLAAGESERGRCQLPAVQRARWDLPRRCWQSCL